MTGTRTGRCGRKNAGNGMEPGFSYRLAMTCPDPYNLLTLF